MARPKRRTRPIFALSCAIGVTLATSAAGEIPRPAEPGLRHIEARKPAALIIHDALGVDARSLRYTEKLTRTGFEVFEVELAANPLDGWSSHLPDDGAAAELVSRAALALRDDPRIDRSRVAAIGFGLGARVLALATQTAEGGSGLAAQALLYPGCAALLDTVAQRPEPNMRGIPTLLLHGDADPANAPADCEDLGLLLAETAPLRRVQYTWATYAWDAPEIGGRGSFVYPRPDGRGSVSARHSPHQAERSTGEVAEFLISQLGLEVPIEVAQAGCPEQQSTLSWEGACR
jgi:dienelactone hydrolase